MTFTVDAFPARRFRGKVHQVRNAPINIQNVVTYDAVVRIDNKDLLLKPGMTANVQFLVSEKEDALTIPEHGAAFQAAGREKREPRIVAPGAKPNGAPESARGGRAGPAGSGGGGGEARRVRQVKIYLLKDGKAQPVEIQVGITDGSKTEVIDSALKENDPIIIGLSSSANQGQAGVGQSVPAAPQPRLQGFR